MILKEEIVETIEVKAIGEMTIQKIGENQTQTTGQIVCIALEQKFEHDLWRNEEQIKQRKQKIKIERGSFSTNE